MSRWSRVSMVKMSVRVVFYGGMVKLESFGGW